MERDFAQMILSAQVDMKVSAMIEVLPRLLETAAKMSPENEGVQEKRFPSENIRQAFDPAVLGSKNEPLKYWQPVLKRFIFGSDNQQSLLQ